MEFHDEAEVSYGQCIARHVFTSFTVTMTHVER